MFVTPTRQLLDHRTGPGVPDLDARRMPAAGGRPPAVRAEHGAVQGGVGRQGTPHGPPWADRGREPSPRSRWPRRRPDHPPRRGRAWGRRASSTVRGGPMRSFPGAWGSSRMGQRRRPPKPQVSSSRPSGRVTKLTESVRRSGRKASSRPVARSHRRTPSSIPTASSPSAPMSPSRYSPRPAPRLLTSVRYSTTVRHLHQPHPLTDDGDPAHRPIPTEVRVADGGGPVDQRPARPGVPQPARAVSRTDQQEVAARVERHPAHPLGMALEGGQDASLGRGPDLDPASGSIEAESPTHGRRDARRGRERILRRRRAARIPSSRNRYPRPRRRPHAPCSRPPTAARPGGMRRQSGRCRCAAHGSPGPSPGPRCRSSRRAERPPTGCRPR